MILVLGGGVRGAQLAAKLGGPFESDFETTSMRDVRRVVAAHEPTGVVWMASSEDVVAAETDEDRAYLENAEAVINLAAATMEFSATPILVSTPEVFGQRGGPWSEADEPQPRSVWAESRRRGEILLMRAAPRALVLRVGPLLSRGLVAERDVLAEPVEVGAARRVSPIGIDALGDAIEALLAADVAGVVHVAPDEPAVRERDLWIALAEALKIGIENVRSTEERALAAPNPAMHADRLRKVAVTLASWRTSLDDVAPAAVPASAPKDEGPDVWAEGDGWSVARRSLERGATMGGEGPRVLFVEDGKIALTVVADGRERDVILKRGDFEALTAAARYELVALSKAVVFDAAGPLK